MKKECLSILAASLITFGSAGLTNATIINYTATDLTDTGTGDLWEYSYTVSDNTFASDTGFTIYFDVGLYDFLDPAPDAPNQDWDVLTLNPDSLLPDEGAYDAYALTSSASLADAFTVSFEWLGGGTGPGSQSFHIYDGLTWDILQSGETVPNPAPVPEPSAMILIGTGLVGILGSRFRKKRPNKIVLS
jgi:hypothetical protein